jgi:hypothetical protein
LGRHAENWRLGEQARYLDVLAKAKQRGAVGIKDQSAYERSGDSPMYSLAHLKLARQAIYSALYGLIQMGWIDENAAVRLAADWLYNNPNRFFDLGLTPITADDYA